MDEEVISCRHCGRTARIEARGLCKACYERLRVKGTLHRYPRMSWGVASIPRGLDVDELAVDLAVAGHPVRLSPRERRAAVARLAAVGASIQETADRLRVSTRTVERHRAALREVT